MRAIISDFADLRPRAGLFLSQRRIRIFFHTGSMSKFEQARFALQRVGLGEIFHSNAQRGALPEQYSTGAQGLLLQKLEEVPLGHRIPYFVEDTWIRIEAISRSSSALEGSVDWATDSVPGFEAKEWFSKTTFDELNAILDAAGDRRATVYSAIALHVPGIRDPQIFLGRTTGVVAPSPSSGSAEDVSPWLDPNSFSGWFIPDGTSERLSDLGLEASFEFDFRARALSALADKLEEYVAILNLDAVAFTTPRAERELTQPSLFDSEEESVPIIVVGHTCTGKTTFGQFAAAQLGGFHVEASEMLRSVAESDRLLGPGARPQYVDALSIFASHGRDVLARHAAEYLRRVAPSGTPVLTGFRTLQELEFLLARYPRALVILLESPDDIRFQRFVERSRESDVTPESFRKKDREAISFGFIRCAEHISSLKYRNDGTIHEYRRAIAAIMTGRETASIPGIDRRGVGADSARESQLFRVLQTLSVSDAKSPSDIEVASTKVGARISREAARKVLGRYPELTIRGDDGRGETNYRLSQDGESYVRLLRARIVRL